METNTSCTKTVNPFLNAIYRTKIALNPAYWFEHKTIHRRRIALLFFFFCLDKSEMFLEVYVNVLPLCCRSSSASTMRRGLTDIMSPYLKHPSRHCGLSQWPSSLWVESLAPSPWVSLSIALEGKFNKHFF